MGFGEETWAGSISENEVCVLETVGDYTRNTDIKIETFLQYIYPETQNVVVRRHWKLSRLLLHVPERWVPLRKV